tara:strand:+ start:30763 stop:31374 length:612 start_codon:yes stop_codon:yes gene_type:complete
MNNISKFWGEQDVSVRFCENKYDKVYWVAEYYNTISSLSYIFIGLLFWDTKISHIGIKLSCMGIGAVLLHMTLRHYTQLIDEGVMIVLSYDGARYINPILPKYGVVLLLMIYIAFNDCFVYFLILFTIMKVYIVRQMYLKNTKNSKLREIFFTCYVLLFILGTVCWIMDQVICEQVGVYQMHAWWHIFTALSIGCGMTSLCLK